MASDFESPNEPVASRPILSLRFLLIALGLGLASFGGIYGYFFLEEYWKHDPKAVRTETLWRDEHPEEYEKMTKGRGQRSGPPASISGMGAGDGGGGSQEGGDEGGGRRRRGRPASDSTSGDSASKEAASGDEATKEETAPVNSESKEAESPKEGDGGEVK